MRMVSCLLLSSGLLHAAEPETASDWIDSLSETYRQRGSYIITYHSEGENKSLDATLASDPEAGLAVLHLIFTKDGQRREHRQWSTDPGDMYLDANGQRGHITGIKAEMRSMEGIFSEAGKADIISAFAPKALLSKTRMNTSFSVSGNSNPVWSDELKDAKLVKVTDKAIAFLTEDSGELTISRESGLVTRQLVIGDDGEKRLLEQVSYRKNPDQEEIVALTKDWQTAGSRPIEEGMLKGMRASFFQDVIRLIEAEELTVDQLKERMESRAEGLADFAMRCFDANPKSRFATMDWEGVARDARATVHEAWKKKTPDAESKEKEFDALWARHSKDAANGFLKKFQQDKDVRRSALEDIFGPGAELKASTGPGKEARDFMESKLCGSYLQEVIREKLVPFLGAGKRAE